MEEQKILQNSVEQLILLEGRVSDEQLNSYWTEAPLGISMEPIKLERDTFKDKPDKKARQVTLADGSSYHFDRIGDCQL